MIEQFVIGAIVAAAGLHSAWSLMPAMLRTPFAAWLARLAGRCGVAAPLVDVLKNRLANQRACNECAACKGCSAAPREERPRPQG